jgi:hypothetical protein
MTKVRCGPQCEAYNLLVKISAQHIRDEEECRLFTVYEVSSAKEHIAASKLLNWHDVFSHPTYRKLLHDLRSIRTECNANMLAITAHHQKIRELLMVH